MQELYWKNIRESAQLFSYSVHRLNVKSGYQFPRHQHHNFHEAVLLLQGDLLHRVNGKVMKQKANELLYLPSESVHSLQSSGAEFLNVLLPLDWLQDGGISLPEEEAQLIPLKTEEVTYLTRLYERFAMNTEKNLAHIQYFRMILILAEWILSNQDGRDHGNTSSEPDWLNGAIRKLSSGQWNPMSVSELADLCHVSPEHLSRTWKEVTGESPVRYLKNLRLDKAARMLQISNDTIMNVADQAGFDSPGYFFRKFKDRYGMSPAQYRKQIRRLT